MGTALSTFGVTPGFACVETSGHLIAVMYSYHSLPLALAVLSFKSACALYTNGSVIAPCSSPLYCQGEILRQIELAQPYEDSKTFVDLPTTRPLEEVIEAFNNLTKPIQNNTELQTFLEDYFGEAGSELEPVRLIQTPCGVTALRVLL